MNEYMCQQYTYMSLKHMHTYLCIQYNVDETFAQINTYVLWKHVNRYASNANI